MRNLVKRYVAAMIRDAKTEEGLTEENFKELKQDISSFRFEVLGLLKGSKLASLRSSKIIKESPLETEEKSDSEGSDKTKKKNFSLFDITSMIHPRSAAIASERHSVSNGAALMVHEAPKEKQKKVNFVSDVKHFGLFHKQSKPHSAEANTNQIFSVSEEVSRQQVDEEFGKHFQLETRVLASKAERSIPGLSEQCVLGDMKRRTRETLNLHFGDSLCSLESEKLMIEDTVPIIPKDAHAKEEASAKGCELKITETVIHEDYVTTRL